MRDTRTNHQATFLRYIYAANSISAALQTRNKNGRVYGEKFDEKVKDDFKKFLLNRTMNLWLDIKELKKEEILKEIEALKSECESKFGSIFNGGNFRIGVSQKLICLYAKFLWVSGQLISPPPLIPYDGVVKKLLNDDSLEDWTVLDDMKEYERICVKIEAVSNRSSAKWELEKWNESMLKH